MSRAPGWGWPTSTARKAHYFPEGEVRSLCGRYARFLPVQVEAEPKTSPDDCASCRRRLDAAKAAE